MNPQITAGGVPAHFMVELTFADGSHGTVDREAGTIMWPNGVDLDPDMLFEAAHRTSAKA